MRQSKLFTKTRREAPKDEVSKNAELLIRAGFIHKEMAGVYSFLPLGLRVLKKVQEIVREELNAIGGQETFLATLQDKNLWEKTDRWDDKKVDNWFKTAMKNGTEVGLGLSHEEPLTNILSEYVTSYRDLPLFVYQFQTKFRNELRAKSGIMRGREFSMKDMYSFARDEEEHKKMFAQAREAYGRIFDRLGIGSMTYLTYASGGVFSKESSEEFQTISSAGEDNIFVDEKKKIAVNEEVMSEISKFGLKEKDLKQMKAIEVGNIFHLGTKYSEALGLKFATDEGESKLAIMGCYGIGIGRVIGTIVETLSDDKGIIWPESVSPFKIHLVLLPGSDKVKAYADKLYQDLTEKNIEVFYDDRDMRAGEKFQDSDLIGIPYRVIVSEKTLDSGRLEMKERKSGEVKMISEEELISGKLN